MIVVLTGDMAVVTTLASGTNAGFRYPSGVAVDVSGNVFVADFPNQRIRKVTPGGGTRIGSVTPCVCCADVAIEAPP